MLNQHEDRKYVTPLFETEINGRKIKYQCRKLVEKKLILVFKTGKNE